MKSIRERLGKGRGGRESKLRVLSGRTSLSPQDEKRDRQRWYKNQDSQRNALGVLVILSITLLLAPKVLFTFPQLQIGDLVQRDIKAPTNLEIPDPVTNQKNQEKVAAETPAVYDFDLKLIKEVEEKVTMAFQNLRTTTLDTSARRGLKGSEKEVPVISEALRAQQREFQDKLGISLSEMTLTTLERLGYDQSVEERVKHLYRPLMEKGLIRDKELLMVESERGIILRAVGEGKESFLRNIGSIMDVKEAEKNLREQVLSNFKSDPAQGAAVLEITSKLLVPNVTFNKNETVLRKQEKASHVKPLFYQVQKGETLLRAGERVTADHLPLLQVISRYHQTSTLVQIFSGLLLIVMVIVGIFLWDLKRYQAGHPSDNSKLLLLAILLVGTLVLAKSSHFFLSTLADRFSFIGASTISFALPVASGPMLVALLFDSHIALLSAFTLSLFMGLLVPEETLFILYTFVGSLVAAFSVIKCSRRSGLLRAGFFVGVANLSMIFATNLYEGELLTLKGFFELLFGLSAGFLVTLVVSALLPLLESLFKVTTDIKLLELLDPNQPLLRDLFLNARGTYYHSMMVSHLAESAAEAIDENPLLARVSCYYHDIGKMLKPEYYIENQLTEPNRHDKLSPSMSSLIIASHVKEGIELARSYKLPEAIIDIIPQHHGTRLMRYFYEKAKKEQGPELPPVKEEDFRYPGPKPQTKIAGIVMLADGVEASSRVLTDPSPSRITTLVDKTATNIFIDGQLDECNLTMSDLRKIKDCFTRVLTGVFHRRIEYPGAGPPHYGETGHEGLHQQPTAEAQAQNKEFKRLGQQDSSDVGIS